MNKYETLWSNKANIRLIEEGSSNRLLDNMIFAPILPVLIVLKQLHLISTTIKDVEN
ncbi:hypothetical protein [Neobacillus niacini]|uniref:hypothetical protein n=1 Tax=Neobacillus niacini TaxID=86668 RepID=UPI000ADAFF3B|nr:hypothetical protein [Neobacillus niacini]